MASANDFYGPFSYKYIASAGDDNIILAHPCFLKRIIVGDAVGSSVIEISDHATEGDGNVVVYLAGENIGPAVYDFDLEFDTGLTIDLANQTHVTVIYR